VCLEQAGKSADAAAAYQKALTASPGNLTARVGVTRLSRVPSRRCQRVGAAEDSDQPEAAEPDASPEPDEAPSPSSASAHPPAD